MERRGSRRSSWFPVRGPEPGNGVRVVPLLRAAGHDVYATTPTGLGDRAHLATPAIDLDTHITDVSMCSNMRTCTT